MLKFGRTLVDCIRPKLWGNVEKLKMALSYWNLPHL